MSGANRKENAQATGQSSPKAGSHQKENSPQKGAKIKGPCKNSLPT